MRFIKEKCKQKCTECPVWTVFCLAPSLWSCTWHTIYHPTNCESLKKRRVRVQIRHWRRCWTQKSRERSEQHKIKTAQFSSF